MGTCYRCAVVFLLLAIGSACGIFDPNAPHSTTGPVPPHNASQGRIYRSRSVGDIMIYGVPAYTWWRGCGPTAAGMVVGFYDENSQPLMPSADSIHTAEENMISSQGNWDDYCLPIETTQLLPDKSELPIWMRHADNCVADFMFTSQSARGLWYGWSYFSDVGPSVKNYVEWISNGDVSVTYAENANFPALWAAYRKEIDEGRPVVFLVDSNGDGSTDHFITAIGYNAHTKEYAAYNTWDYYVHWFPFVQMKNTSFGIYGAVFFDVQGTPDDDVAIQAECRKLSSSTSCQENSACEWCTIYQTYGQCYRKGLCQEAVSACQGRVGYTCLQQGAPEYLWCSASWFHGLMPCHAGQVCEVSEFYSYTTPC